MWALPGWAAVPIGEHESQDWELGQAGHSICVGRVWENVILN